MWHTQDEHAMRHRMNYRGGHSNCWSRLRPVARSRGLDCGLAGPRPGLLSLRREVAYGDASDRRTDERDGKGNVGPRAGKKAAIPAAFWRKGWDSNPRSRKPDSAV